MRTMKRASGAAAVALVALALGACSEAKDAADKAADDAKEKAGDAGSSLAADASDKAQGALSDATGGAEGSATSGTGGSDDAAGSGAEGSDGAGADGSGAGGDVGGISLDLGDFAQDPSAQAVGTFYGAREEVRGGGESTALEAVTGADHLQDVLEWAAAHPATGSFRVVVTAVDGSSVSACVGEDGVGPRVLTVEDGKVTGNARGDFAC